MPDINLTLGSDTKEFKKGIKDSRKASFKLAKDIRKMNERERAIKRRGDESSRKTQLRLDKRLSRKRAKSRLRSIKENVRAEKRAIREIERAQKASNRRRQRLFKAGLGGVAAGGLAIGAAGIIQGRKLLEFRKNVAHSAIQAKLTRPEQAKLGTDITDTAIQKGISRDKLLIAIGTLIDKSGNMALANEQMGRIAEILVGSPTSPEDLGKGLAALSASLKGQGKTTDELIKIFEVVVAQGDIGSINTAALAQSGEKIFGAILTKGLANKEGILQAGALLQAGAGGATTEGAITNFKGFLDAMIQNREKFVSAGFDPLTKGGFFKPMEELVDGITSIKGIFSGDKVNQSALKSLIPEKKARDLFSLLAQQSLLGEDAPFKSFIREGRGAGSNFDAKFERLFSEGSTQFTRLGGLGAKLGDKAFEPVINDLTKSIEKLLENPAALKQLEETFRAFGELLIVAAKVGGAGVRGAGFLLRSSQSSAVQADFEAGKRSLKNLPQSLRDKIEFENQGSLGFFSNPSLEEKKKFVSDLDKMILNLQVINNPDGTVNATLRSDDGNKTTKINVKR